MNNTKSNILLRVYLSFVIFIVLGIIILLQISKIQFKEGKYWRSLSDSISLKYMDVEAIRGNIYSADRKLMVTSIPIYEVHIDFKTLCWEDQAYFDQHIDSFSFLMSQLFKDRSEREYRLELTKARRSKSRYFPLKRNINFNELKKLSGFPFFREGKYKGGFIVEQRTKRIQPFNLLAKRTIGFKRPDLRGVGIEGAFDKELAGKSGKRLMQRISGGNWIPADFDNALDPEDGKDIVTTIDIDIQDITENALLNALIQHQAQNGCAVVMEVQTGHILAIANLKKDDKGNYSEEYNYAVGASTEPGSTFKLVSALIMLEDGVVSPNDVINTKNGEVKFFDRVMKDSKPGGYGEITFRQAFEVSSNVAISSLVYQNYGHRPRYFLDKIEKLGITKPLNIEIPGEGKPVFKKPGQAGWSGTTLPWMSVGYELQMTPLQILTLYNGIANNGIMIKPIIVKEIWKVNKLEKSFKTEILNDKLCSQKTLQTLNGFLTGVVEHGTASNIRSSSYKIAGKTGTALVATRGGYETERIYQASFVGFFPAENPKYSCIVVITNPASGQIYGSSVAAPVFRQIADAIFVGEYKKFLTSDYDYKPDYQSIGIVSKGYIDDILQLSSIFGLTMKGHTISGDFVRVEKGSGQLLVYDASNDNRLVPDVTGMCLSDAIYLLENKGLNVNFTGTGKVISQSLAPGTAFQKGYKITLRLGS